MSGIGCRRSMVVFGLFACVYGAHAQDQASVDSGPKWGAHIDFEAKPGSKRSLGEADLFLPLVQNENTLVFGSLRGRFDDHDSREGNFGLGVRHMHDSGWNLGAYGYFDRRRTDNDNYFNQGALGAEILGRDWDFRTNVYHPIGDRAKGLGTVGGGAVTATLAGTVIQVVTPGSITREERALKGYDAEVGWRVPFFGAADHSQLRLYLGGYRFADGGMTVSGPRLRAELALAEVPGLWQGSQFFLGGETQHDDARGTQSFLSLRLRIPLGGKPERSRQLNMQERRMTTPVMRDVDIVTQSRITSSTPRLVETATATAGGQPITVLDSATTTGAGLPGAVAAAGANSTVVLSGVFNTSAITAMQPGQTLMGAGVLTVQTPSGRTAILTTPMATITGAVAGNNPTVALADNTTLRGLTITNVATGGIPNPFAVEGNAVTGATVVNSVLQSTGIAGGGTSFGLRFLNSSNLTVRDNTLMAVGATGTSAIGLQVLNSTGVLVTGNTMSATGGTVNEAIRIDTGSFVAGSTGNTIAAGICSTAGVSTGSIGLAGGATCP